MRCNHSFWLLSCILLCSTTSSCSLPLFNMAVVNIKKASIWWKLIEKLEAPDSCQHPGALGPVVPPWPVCCSTLVHFTASWGYPPDASRASQKPQEQNSFYLPHLPFLVNNSLSARWFRLNPEDCPDISLSYSYCPYSHKSYRFIIWIIFLK